MQPDGRIARIEKALDVAVPAPMSEADVNQKVAETLAKDGTAYKVLRDGFPEVLHELMAALVDLFEHPPSGVAQPGYHSPEAIAIMAVLDKHRDARDAISDAQHRADEQAAFEKMNPEQREVYAWYKGKEDREKADHEEMCRIGRERFAAGLPNPLPSHPCSAADPMGVWHLHQEHHEREKRIDEDMPASVKAIEAERDRSHREDECWYSLPCPGQMLFDALHDKDPLAKFHKGLAGQE
jgi:hypothetical protein